MNTIAQTAQFLKENNNFIIIPHRSPDGDCLGSSSALLLALRALGKNVKIALPTPVTKRLMFIWDESFEQGDFEPEVAIAVDDAATYMMLELYDDIFAKAKKSICIDHHGTNEGFAKDLNLVDSTSAAAGEIVYRIICEMGVGLTKDIAERLYVSIADDTGGFQYSNTTSETLKIAASLHDCNIESDEIMRKLFATHTTEEMNLLKFVTDRMEYHFDSKVCLTYVDDEALLKSGAEMNQADAWIGLTRSTEGVEVGLMFKLIAPNETRISLRSNEYVDVSAVAKKFGGGGHVRAAGVTINESYETAKEMLLNELKELV
ncbi:MAG: DHH family phosphoesterase [Clostridia bacterium]|nr:DHH family phosphoesterase [Clostridia bacterium]